MSEEKIYSFNALEIIKRDERYYLRYDSGSHTESWREDEISQGDVTKVQSGKIGIYDVVIDLQKRLIASGIDPHISNWTPTGQVGD